jgi:transcriptional regulatory protein LevR
MNGLQDTAAPVIQLEPLIPEDISQLLQRLADVHAVHYKYKKALTAAQLKEFLGEVVNRLGAQELLTPREVVRDFISVLNILQQNPQLTFKELIQSSNFQPTRTGKNSDVDENSEFAEFTL